MKRMFYGKEIEIPQEITIPKGNLSVVSLDQLLDSTTYFTDSSNNLCNLLEEIGIEKSLKFLRMLKDNMMLPQLNVFAAHIAFAKYGVDKRDESKIEGEKINETIKTIDLLVKLLEKMK